MSAPSLTTAASERVLSVTDLGFDNKGGSLFMAYQQQKEQLAAKSLGGTINLLGIRGIP